MTTHEHPDAEPRSGTEGGVRLSIPRRRLLLDRWNRGLIAAGGQGVIALILAMFVFLVLEAWPLTRGARLEDGRTWPVASRVAAVAADPHRTHMAAAAEDGRLRVVRVPDGAVALEAPLLPEPAADTAPLTVHRVHPAGQQTPFVVSTTDGRVAVRSLDWKIHFVENQRQVAPALGDAAVVTLDPAGRAVPVATAQRRADQTTVAGQLADGTVAVHVTRYEENLFTGERSETSERRELGRTVPLVRLVMDPDQRSLYGGGEAGELVWWDLREPGPPVEVIRRSASPVTDLVLLKGGRTLVVGRADGSLGNWFRIRRQLSEELTRVRVLGPLATGVAHLAASDRDRTFLAVDVAGEAALFYATAGSLLWSGGTPVGPVRAAALAPKGDAVVFAGEDRMAEVELVSPHPEASWKTYFGRVWYEGFEAPDAVWQSTGGTDDFEPKLSLLPLIFGTLKGTLYSLILAVPIAILGAMYTSQFVHASFQRFIKPAVEMMASLPSVVLGLVGGLWLAPRLETHFPALVVILVATPVVLVAGGFAWSRVPAALRARVPEGAEVVWFALVIVAGWSAVLAAGPSIEAALFGGDFQDWLWETLGLRYDQRNAAVVGIAMGFAVIPIIFSIAEDAFSSVPENLAAGSLALGANRWETVTRVVLPTASPAIFSAVMVGLGRAVGETMIVLMATGNTPIMDWSVFNGFRTLSANIAVEIPEAPHGGTLYRTLFLTALLLFAFTFAINTVAELVRVRLRKRFGRL